jgi:hypothetical protein
MDIIQEIDDFADAGDGRGGWKLGAPGDFLMTNAPSNICSPPAPGSALTFKWRTPCHCSETCGQTTTATFYEYLPH